MRLGVKVGNVYLRMSVEINVLRMAVQCKHF